MAKTVFSTGVKVLSAWLNAVFAHVHDGVDSDGHVAAISLDNHADGLSAAHVSGRLPYPNLPNMRLFGYRSKGNISPYVDSLAYYIDIAQMSVLAQNTYAIGSFNCSQMIEIASDLRKQVINSTGDGWEPWVAGNNNGGVPTTAGGWSQAIGDGVWLHLFALGQSDDHSAYDAGFDTSLTAANLRAVATDFDTYRRIGSIFIYEDTTYKIMPFYNYGNVFKWTDISLLTPVRNVSSATLSLTQSLYSAPIPPGVNVLAELTAFISCAGSIDFRFTASDYLENGSNYLYDYSIYMNSGEYAHSALRSVLSNTSQQVLITDYSSGDVTAYKVVCKGWIDDIY